MGAMWRRGRKEICSLPWYLDFLTGTFSSVCQECLGKSSGIQETLRAMEIHRDKVQIQDRGCRALRNFADSCEYNIRLEGTAGAVEGLVLAMLSFPESQEVNEQAVAALLNITKHEKNFLVMVEKDVVDIVRKARQVRIFF
mmetsp:Transcript_16182/g.66957  ORF Transcript_16182/g.66957 Transcript_16182/m.66957 type:complete len:141 (+) Transcript_16182:1480-1902(+)